MPGVFVGTGGRDTAPPTRSAGEASRLPPRVPYSHTCQALMKIDLGLQITERVDKPTIHHSFKMDVTSS